MRGKERWLWWSRGLGSSSHQEKIVLPLSVKKSYFDGKNSKSDQNHK